MNVPNPDAQQNLRRWYLARLRRLAVLDRDTLLSPSRLMDVDKQHLIELAATSQIGAKTAPPPPYLTTATQAILWLCVAGIILGGALALMIGIHTSAPGLYAVAICQAFAVVGIVVIILRQRASHQQVGLSLLSAMVEQHSKEKQQTPESLQKLAEQFALQYASIVERERLIADFAPDVVCLLDRQQVIKCINPACAKLWGYIPAQIMESKITDFISGNEIAFRQACDEAYSSGEERSVTVKFKVADGPPVDLRWTVEWSARHEQFFAIAEDVTNEMRTERIRNEFLALIAHDLRSPIAAMDASLQLLEQGINPYGSMEDHAKKMRERTEYLLRLLNDILEMNKIEESQVDLLREETSMKNLVEESVDLVQELAHEKSIKCEVHTEDARINVDRNRLKRVLVNLLVNAVKFSPEKGVVTISAAPQQNDVVISIKDQGRGISDADKNRIFSKFEQVESSDSAIKGGAGLGLAICRTLVNAHGGTISVDSEVGKGATFTIVLKNAIAGVATTSA